MIEQQAAPLDRLTATGPEGLRTGADYIASIKADGRAVFIDGEPVADVTTHPAFRAAVKTVAGFYDLAAEPANRDLMTYRSPAGRPVLRCFQIPRSKEALHQRRLMSARWAEATFGLMGRTPDHVAGFFTGFAARADVFAAGGAGYAENVVRFYETMRDRHLYCAYALAQPQIDRSKPAHGQSDPTLYAGVVGERDGGIVLRGAQQLATGAVLADYLYLSCIQPLQPGDENYANGVVIPMNAPGLKIYPRRSYASGTGSTFDYPLSSRFDETDCLVVLDDVFVPWEDVFIYRNLEVCRDQWLKTPARVYGNFQAQTRYAVKLRFMLGLTKRLNEMTGTDPLPPVQIQMGELAALATVVENMVECQETMATTDETGIVWPSRTALYAAMALQSTINPWMVDIVRELAGGSMIMLPSSWRDYENPEIAADLERYVASPGTSSRERAALMKMAWELIGTEFAGRHQHYEVLYGGAPFLVKQSMYRHYDFESAKALVQTALDLPEEVFD